eukprot:150115_1
MTAVDWNVDDISLRNQLLKLNKQELIKLCQSKQISHKGTKQDMIKCLIKSHLNKNTQQVPSNSAKEKNENDIKTNDNNKSKQSTQQHRGHKQRHHSHKQRQHKSKKRGTCRMVSKNRKVGRWFLGETLGKGGYSWVKKGYDRKDGHVVALKFTP